MEGQRQMDVFLKEAMNHLPVKICELFFTGGLTGAALLEYVVRLADGLELGLLLWRVIAGLRVFEVVSVIELRWHFYLSTPSTIMN
jgi:hypothetical protein